MIVHRTRRTSTRRATRGLALASALVLCSPWTSGCGSRDADEGPVHRYEVEGILTQLPAGPGRELMIRHVAIPEFVNAVGDTVGMDAMTMGFPVADESVLAGFAPGDSIRFVFEVRWSGTPPLRLTTMERLPSGTELFFGKLGVERP